MCPSVSLHFATGSGKEGTGQEASAPVQCSLQWEEADGCFTLESVFPAAPNFVSSCLITVVTGPRLRLLMPEARNCNYVRKKQKTKKPKNKPTKNTTLSEFPGVSWGWVVSSLQLAKMGLTVNVAISCDRTHSFYILGPQLI